MASQASSATEDADANVTAEQLFAADESDAEDFEDCAAPPKDRGPHSEGLKAQRPPPAVRFATKTAQVSGETRRRKDGKFVKKSKVAHHLYKISKRRLHKKRLLQVASAEDRGCYTPDTAHDWIQVRHAQCRRLAEIMHSHNILTDKTMDKMMYEIEAVLDWLLANPVHAKKMHLGSSALWAAVMAQQHVAMVNDTGWSFKTSALIEKFSLCRIFEQFEPSRAQKEDRDRRSEYIKCTKLDMLPDVAMSIAQLSVLLNKAAITRGGATRGSMLFEGIRKCSDATLERAEMALTVRGH